MKTRPASRTILERPNDGSADIDHVGEYLELDKPRCLAFTLKVPAHFHEHTEVQIDITSTDQGSELTLVQSGVEPNVVRNSWKRMKFKTHVAEGFASGRPSSKCDGAWLGPGRSQLPQETGAV